MAGASEIDTSGRNETSRSWQAKRSMAKGITTRFAFVRNGGSEAMNAVGLALPAVRSHRNHFDHCSYGWRCWFASRSQRLLPEAEHMLDWFHIAMRLTNLRQLAKGVNAVTDGGVRSHAVAELDRAKWRLWIGHMERGLIALVHLRQWARAPVFRPHSLLKEIGAGAFGYDLLPGVERRFYAQLWESGTARDSGFQPALSSQQSTRLSPNEW